MTTANRRRLGAIAVALCLAVALPAATLAAERHESEATGLAFDVPDAWVEVTHGAADDHDHDHDHDHGEEPHADAIPHHALGNYDGITDGVPPAEEGEALIELGALPNAFLCDATLDDATGAMEATYAYFATQTDLPPAPEAREMVIGDGLAVSAMDLTFGDLAAIWIAWPATDDTTAWAFVGGTGGTAEFEATAWAVAESLEVRVTGSEMAAMFSDFAPDDPCGLPDTALPAGGSGQTDPLLLLMGLVSLGLASLIARERMRDARARAPRAKAPA